METWTPPKVKKNLYPRSPNSVFSCTQSSLSANLILLLTASPRAPAAPSAQPDSPKEVASKFQQLQGHRERTVFQTFLSPAHTAQACFLLSRACTQRYALTTHGHKAVTRLSNHPSDVQVSSHSGLEPQQLAAKQHTSADGGGLLRNHAITQNLCYILDPKE